MILSTICLRCRYYKTLSPDECSKHYEKCDKWKEKNVRK